MSSSSGHAIAKCFRGFVYVWRTPARGRGALFAIPTSF